MPAEKATREELTDLLMEFVRNLIKKGATNETEVAVLPSVAMVLEELTRDH